MATFINFTFIKYFTTLSAVSLEADRFSCRQYNLQSLCKLSINRAESESINVLAIVLFDIIRPNNFF
ncbi:hypothetical protein DERP_001087 [Dermatophagoides pteronyssinus]|uniref:Uncharacterized protein n=1 Tax=Dermatophagoides pteronyssinus TaxID=6956 RepID=A0ABQ8JE00_DERPT|nr:hypothetical protein DERP_001087 [Dermatophagoides pteronyssinus]